MLLKLYPLVLKFRALESLYFPAGKSTNTLRGAFVGRTPGSAASPPAGSKSRPSGLSDPPAPYVFRASHLDGRHFPPGAEFQVGFNLFETTKESVEAVIKTFAEIAKEGLGPGRGRAELTHVTGDALLSLSLAPAQAAIHQVTVHFVTPTELKTAGGLADRPEFAILAARLRDRISTLCELYGEGALDIDFRAFAARAAEIRMTRCEIQHESVERRSTRTGQTHPIGGFTGEADYEGDLREFLPYLEAARWTGVGRQTVWGKGELDVH